MLNPKLDRDESDSGRLQYRAGADDRATISVGVVASTAIAVALSIIALVAVMIFLSFVMDYHGEGQKAGTMGRTIAGGVVMLALGTLVILALGWHKRIETRARSLGIWIGMGVAFLIEGTCFLINTR